MDKTEIIVIGTPSLTTKVPADFCGDITGTLIAPSSIVRNLGVMFCEILLEINIYHLIIYFIIYSDVFIYIASIYLPF